MAAPSRRTRAFTASMLAAGVAVLAGGCGSDEGVQSYTVPRAAEPKAAEYRILGAIYPADAPVWYFKFTGTADAVTQHEAAFDQLAASVKLQADPAAMPAFTLPAGWTKTGPREVTRMGVTVRFDEVLKFGPADAPQEVTVSYIPGGPEGGLVPNLNRWAGQVGAEFDALDKAALAQHTRPIPGANGLRVDFRGPKNPAAPRGPMMGRPR